AAVLDMLGRRYHSLGDYGKAAELAERSFGLLQGSPATSLRAEFRCGYAVTLFDMGRSAEAMRIIAEEFEHPPSEPSDLASCLADRAQLAFGAGEPDRGLAYALQAVAAARSGGALSATTEAPALDAVGAGYLMKGDYQEALRYSVL